MRSFSILVSILISFLSNQQLLASRIEGRVTDANNNPLPFCNIYIPNTHLACASNEDGYYSLAIDPGNYSVVYQFIGYKKQELKITVPNTAITVNVIMETEITELVEVVINSDKEDPAYGIIRQAIANREKHLKEINSYTCDVYIKGLQKLTEAPDKVLGIQLNTILDIDSNNTGIIYLSESASTFYYQYPDNSKEIMKASKVSGDNQQFSWNDAASMQMNFYKNLETLEGFTQRGFISPIAENALFFYEYELMSNTADGDHRIYKIALNPKRKADPAYTGIIYITDDDFRISGIQLQLTASNGIEFIDTFKIAQEFYYSEDNTLVLLSNKFDFTYGFFGIKGTGYFHAFYKNYTINPIFEKNFFNGEKTKIEDHSNEQDSIYWSTVRPIKLTTEESVDYRVKDSLAIVKEQPFYKDSVDKAFNKFKLGSLISGYNWRDSNRKILISTNPIFDLLQFNTIEGYVINPKIELEKRWVSKKSFSFNSNLRYGIGSNTFYANGSLTYKYNSISKAYINLSGGSGVQQFNEQGVTPLVNSLYTLLVEENYLKIYEQQYLSLKYGQEVVNGLYINLSSKYSIRQQLNNLPSVEGWLDLNDRQFTSNNYPFYLDTAQYDIPNKIVFSTQLRYTIKQPYISEPGNKFILSSKYPSIVFEWSKAVLSAGNSLAIYDQLQLNVYDEIPLALAGNLDLHVGGSCLITNSTLNEADLLHLKGNATNILRTGNDSYYLLPYYYFSNDTYFFSTNLQWHTEGFLFRQLPLFKQLKLEPVFSFNYLYTDIGKNYFEIAAGVEHLFKIIRIDAAYSPYKFDAGYPVPNFKILIGFGF